jgi:hypothetical protein
MNPLIYEDIYEFTEKQLPDGTTGLLFAYIPGNVFKSGDKIYVDSMYQYQILTVVSVTNYNGYQYVVTNGEWNGEEYFTISDQPHYAPGTPHSTGQLFSVTAQHQFIEPEILAEDIPDYVITDDEVINEVLQPEFVDPVQPRNNLLKYVIIALGAIVLFNLFKK